MLTTADVSLNVVGGVRASELREGLSLPRLDAKKPYKSG